MALDRNFLVTEDLSEFGRETCHKTVEDGLDPASQSVRWEVAVAHGEEGDLVLVEPHLALKHRDLSSRGREILLRLVLRGVRPQGDRIAARLIVNPFPCRRGDGR